MSVPPIDQGIAILLKHDSQFQCPSDLAKTSEYMRLRELEDLLVLVGNLHPADPHPDEVLSEVAAAFALQFNYVFRAYSPTSVPRACFELTWKTLIGFGAKPSSTQQTQQLAKEFADSIDRSCVLILRDIIMDIFHPEEAVLAS